MYGRRTGQRVGLRGLWRPYPWSRTALVALVCVGGYAVVFPALFGWMGSSVTTVSVIPVVMVSWLTGISGGLMAAALLAVVSVVGVYWLEPTDLALMMQRGGAVGTVILVVVAVAVGYLGEVIRRANASRVLLDRIIASTPNMVYIYDVVTERILYANQAVGNMLECNCAELVGEPMARAMAQVHPDDNPYRDLSSRIMVLQTQDLIESEYRMQQAGGGWRWMVSRELVFARDERGRPVEILGMAMDITDRKLREQRLHSRSYQDGLTGTHNRAYFEEEVARLTATCEDPVTVLMADLNNLKLVNDELGHAAGDELIKRAATVLANTFRPGDHVARIGGDEFAVLLPGAPAEVAPRLVERVRAAIEAANVGQTPPLSIALGIATATHGSGLQAALALADERMYANKASIKATEALLRGG